MDTTTSDVQQRETKVKIAELVKLVQSIAVKYFLPRDMIVRSFILHQLLTARGMPSRLVEGERTFGTGEEYPYHIWVTVGTEDYDPNTVIQSEYTYRQYPPRRYCSALLSVQSSPLGQEYGLCMKKGDRYWKRLTREYNLGFDLRDFCKVEAEKVFPTVAKYYS